MPDAMKIAKVMPIFKMGDGQLVNNYRPISILCLFSYTLERAEYIRTSFKYNILSDSQFGFGEEDSNMHAILHLVDKITTAREKTLHTLGVLLDLSKAFNTIDHSIRVS